MVVGRASLSLRVLRVAWVVCVLSVALLLTLAFASADWLLASDAAAAERGLAAIRLGPVFACLERILPDASREEVCGAYGLSLGDIPHSSWRAGAFFLGVAIVALWLVAVVSALSLCKTTLRRPAARFLGFAGLFCLIGLLTLAGGLGDASNGSGLEDLSAFAPCLTSGPFQPGDCKFSAAALLGAVSTGLAVAVTGYGFMI